MTRPYDVTKTREFLDMESDNFPQKNGVWSILHSGSYVSLHQPGGGGYVQIPRKQFNAIVDWYMRDQPAVADAKIKKTETA